MDKVKEDLKLRAREHLLMTIMSNPMNVLRDRLHSAVDGVVEMIARELQDELDRKKAQEESYS